MRKDLREMHKKIMMGDGNPRWNGGTSEYPNHNELKKIRIKILKKSKGKCEICGNPANVVHHIDGSKTNHSMKNLIPLCDPCHWAVHKKEYGERSGTSKYVRKYGMTLEQIGNKLNMSLTTVLYWLKNPNKRNYIENEIQKIKETNTNHI